VRLFYIFVVLTSGTILLSSFLSRHIPGNEDLRPRLQVFELADSPVFNSNEMRLAKLGQQLFHDARLSLDEQRACSSCHQPEYSFAEPRPLAAGISAGYWNAPAIINLYWAGWLFWDGRSDSLEMQAMQHLESIEVYGISRWHMGRLLYFHYSEQYEKNFGPFPVELAELFAENSESAKGALPALTKLMVPASLNNLWQQFHISQPQAEQSWFDQYQDLSEVQRQALDQVFGHGVLALAQYQRALIARDAPFDRYLKRLRSMNGRRALNDEFTSKELRGFLLFTGKAGCDACHSGPLFTDGDFHHTGLARGSRQTLGRAEGLIRWTQHESACTSETIAEKVKVFCQPGERQRILADENLLRQSLGQIKTPSLRNVAQTAPYMSDGSIARLEEVLQAYNQAFTTGLGKPDPRIKPLGLSAAELSDLLAVMQSLSSSVEDLSGN